MTIKNLIMNKKLKKQRKYLQVYKKALPLHTIPMRLWCNW